MNKTLVTINEAAIVLRVQDATIWLYIRCGSLSIVALACGEYRLKKSEVKRLRTKLRELRSLNSVNKRK
jgi:predicted site-specific integrase-resolvase